jgi:Arc/MetJ-type ribon-helix-helix transcriptional regulator
MTMRKVTVSLPEETAHRVEALVQAGIAASFSAYVAAAATASLERDRALAELREHTGGPRGGELRARAARLFGDDPAAAAVTNPTDVTARTAGARSNATGTASEQPARAGRTGRVSRRKAS